MHGTQAQLDPMRRTSRRSRSNPAAHSSQFTSSSRAAGSVRTQRRPQGGRALDFREHAAEAVVGQVHDRVVVLRLAEAVERIVRELLRRVTADAGSERDAVAGDGRFRDREVLKLTLSPIIDDRMLRGVGRRVVTERSS